MTDSPHVLLISPSAPPKNGAEAIQVGRIMHELSKRHAITLATTPVTRGWVFEDASLRHQSKPANVIQLRLPFHDLSTRVFCSRHLRRWHVPDSEIWLTTRERQLAKGLSPKKPQIIYSRSFPLSAAVLAMRIKRRLGLPWVMHLSDPWSDNTYRQLEGRKKARDQRLEKQCFQSADAICLTTPGFRDFYAAKYPEMDDRMYVVSNVVPAQARPESPRRRLAPESKLHMLYSGALYGQRNPGHLIKALETLARDHPPSARQLKIWFVGNMTDEIRNQLTAVTAVEIVIAGKLSYQETRRRQESADVLLSIEPDSEHPLDREVLPSKIVDYISAGRPILALTPEASVTDRYCRQGFGWSAAPSQTSRLVGLLRSITQKAPSLRSGEHSTPVIPAELLPATNATRLSGIFSDLCR